jgi:integrase
MRFTDATIRALKARGERYEVVEDDGTGLALRVSQRGAKTFGYLYRFDGTPRRLTLGVYRDRAIEAGGNGLSHDARGLPYLTLADARIKLAEARKLRESGVDPAAQAVGSHAAAREAKATTLEAVSADFIERYCKAKGRRSWRETERIFKRAVYPTLGQRPIGEITDREIVKLLNAIADNNGPIAANRTLSAVRKMLNWAKRSQRIIDSNPAADIDKPGEERRGTRVLNDEELREVWTAAEALGYPYGHFTKALLLTGRRRGQVQAMQHSQVDPAARVWTPVDGTANKEAPELPLSADLETLIAECLAAVPTSDDDDHVFAGARRECAGDVTRTVRTGAINSFGDLKSQLDSIIAANRAAAGNNKPMPAWSLSRDIRRTVKTRLAELGVEKDIRDLLLGHARQGMDAVYDHSRRREQKREAMERWAVHLAGIVSPPDKSAKVVPLRPAAQ